MYELTKISEATTMSSREIAEITNKEHRHVLRDCDVLNENYDKLSLPKIGQCDYRAENGQKYREYRLNRMQTFDLMTGYSLELRIKVLRRWEELEKKNQQPLIPQSLPEALRLAADLAEKVQERERQLEAAKPKIVFAEAVAGSSNSILIRELAKLIAQNGYDIGQDRLFEWLVQKNFIIRKRRWSATKGQYLNEYEPSQLAINMGILESSERVIGDGNNGTFTKITVKVTGKGQEYLVNRIMNEYRKEAV